MPDLPSSARLDLDTDDSAIHCRFHCYGPLEEIQLDHSDPGGVRHPLHLGHVLPARGDAVFGAERFPRSLRGSRSSQESRRAVLGHEAQRRRAHVGDPDTQHRGQHGGCRGSRLAGRSRTGSCGGAGVLWASDDRHPPVLGDLAQDVGGPCTGVDSGRGWSGLWLAC